MTKSFYAISQEPGATPYRPKFTQRSPVPKVIVETYGKVTAVNRCIHCHKMLKLGCPPILGTILGSGASRPHAS